MNKEIIITDIVYFIIFGSIYVKGLLGFNFLFFKFINKLKAIVIKKFKRF